jgi:DNA-binding PadR family transcriptional regulator
MSLPHALLTALVERPSTGAELARRFDRSIGRFWQATHQQIYRELARLEEARWVRSRPVEAARGRERSYEVLAAGRRELKRWIGEYDDTPRAVRDELMLRLRAEAAVGPAGLEASIRARIEREEQRLAIYREFERQAFEGREATRERRLRRLIVTSGIRMVALRLEIAREALEILAMPGSGR